MKHAVLIVALVGCGSTTVERGVCGNGLVEPGEDCDSTDARCEACGITCVATQDCLDYDAAGGTAGFTCGPDHFCHAPSGLFEAAGNVSLPATSFRITDTSFDGVGDIVVQSQTAVSVLFGDADGSLTAAEAIQTPFPQGPAVYADLDGDGSLDVIAPTADGIVAYTTPFGVPSPYPFPSFVPDSQGVPQFVQPLPTPPFEEHLVIIATSNNTQQLGFLVLDVQQQPPLTMGAGNLCGATVQEFDPENVEAFVIGPGQEIIAVTLRPPNGAAHVCAFEVDRTGQLSYAVTPITFTPTAELQGRAVLANLHGQACPSLVAAQGVTSTLVEYPPKTPSPPCAFGSTPVAVAGAPAGAQPVGTLPLVPNVAGLGNIAVALTTGIYGFAAAQNTLVELYQSDRALGAIKFVDLDGDGDVDGVALGQHLDDIDLLYRGINGSQGFTRFRFDTEDPIVGFLLGDFDGNEHPDVAYVERGANTERLSIAYGTADRLLPGATVGTFSKVLSVIPGNIPDSNDRFSVISDLAVLFEAGAGSQLALLHGSPQRTMLAFFDPRAQPVSSKSTFRGVVAGNFSGGDGGHNDVLAIEDIGSTQLYVSNGANGGELERGALPSTSAVIVACDDGSVDHQNSFCIDSAQYTAWHVDDAHDLVLGVDAHHSMILLDPRMMQPSSEAPIQRFTGKLPAPDGTSVRQLLPITLDDGSERLLVSFTGGLGQHTGAVDLCTIDPASGPACTDVGAIIATATGESVACLDAGFARVAPAHRFEPPDSTTGDLLVLCHRELGGDSLYRVAPDGARVERLIDTNDADAMQVGDVTGDGIADLVLLDHTFAVPTLRVFRQCTSRDVACNSVLGDSPVGP